MSKVKQRLLDLGFTKEQIEQWLNSPIKALSEAYKEDCTPQRLINEDKEDIVLALLDDYDDFNKGGDFSL